MRRPIYVAIIAIILVAIGFTALMLILRYDEKGETNMPFEVTKISMISTTSAEDIKDDKNLWNKSVGEDNDIYIYIEKNKEYTKKSIIEKVEIDNINIIKRPQKGEIFIYKPSTNEKLIFENKEEYKTDKITFTGDEKTNIKALQISNQGGVLQFRIANQNIGNLVSNDKELNYQELLKKINIIEEEIKAKVSFDMTIVLSDGKEFKTTVELNLPAEDMIEEGKSSKELTDLNLVFKRIEN